MPPVLRRLCITLALVACQPVGSGDDGLVLVSDTAQVGPPPACNAETPTTSEGTTGGDASTGDASTGAGFSEGVADLSLRSAPERVNLSLQPAPGAAADLSLGSAPERANLSLQPATGAAKDLSLGPAPRAAPDPGTSFCAQFTNAATCDGTQRKDGEQVIGECHWQQVVPVVPGTCEATQLYNTCVHVPVSGGPCEAPGSCGQIGLGVYGRTGCDGTIEILVVPPGQAFCASPTDWPLCWPRADEDIAPECTCICS